MPSFEYTARDNQGKSVRGEEDSSSEAALVSLLQSRNLVVTKITLQAASSGASKSRRGRTHRRVKTEDLQAFIRETATLLDVGVPFIRVLDLISGQIRSDALSKALEQVKADVMAGSAFHVALAKHPRVFPVLWPFLIEAGETSGTLPKVLTQLSDNLEATINLKKKIVSALIYPAVLITVAIGAVMLFMMKIIPIFAKIFESFNAKLPAFTLAVVGISNFLQHYFLVFAVVVGLTVYFLRLYIRTPEGRRMADRLVLRIPLFSILIIDSIAARIAMHLSTLLKSGINLMQSIDITSRAAGNAVFKESLEKVSRDVQQGKSLSSSLEKNAVFSPTMVNLINIGEETGKLSQMIERVAAYYEGRVDTFVARLGTLIEPIVLLFVGGIVGVIVIAMFLPIFRLSSAIH